MAKVVHALPIEQQQPLIDELNGKVAAYQQHEEELNAQRKLCREAEVAALQKSGCVHGPTFTFTAYELFEAATKASQPAK